MLHLATVEPFTLGLLKQLRAKDYLQQFVLVGGTALALQLGHRKSIDLDMFTCEVFDPEKLLAYLKTEYNVVEQIVTKGALIADIETIKTDFIKFKYSFKYPFKEEDGIRYLAVEDIAPMKLDAITGRGSKKDFYDLYFLLEKYSLEELLDFYDKMYQHSTLFQVIKSLTWFEDADIDGIDRPSTGTQHRKGPARHQPGLAQEAAQKAPRIRRTGTGIAAGAATTQAEAPERRQHGQGWQTDDGERGTVPIAQQPHTKHRPDRPADGAEHQAARLQAAEVALGHVVQHVGVEADEHGRCTGHMA